MFGKKSKTLIPNPPSRDPLPPQPSIAAPSLNPRTVDWHIGKFQGVDVAEITMRRSDDTRRTVGYLFGMEDGFRKVVATAAVAGIRAAYDRTPKKEKEQPEGDDVAIPYIGFNNETLAKLPEMKAGETFNCPHCWQTHAAEGAGDTLFYKCNDRTFLAACNGKNVVHTKPDVKGQI